MFDVPGDLDAIAAKLATTTGYRVTTDPSEALPLPCLFMALPDIVERQTLTGLRVSQPVWVLTDKVGKAARDELLTMLPNVLLAVGEGITAFPDVLTIGRTEYRGFRLPVPLTISQH